MLVAEQRRGVVSQGESQARGLKGAPLKQFSEIARYMLGGASRQPAVPATSAVFLELSAKDNLINNYVLVGTVCFGA